MSYENTSLYLTKGTRVRIGSSDLPGYRSISGLGGGGASEIDVTTMRSVAREFATGLADFGSVTIDGVAAPQNPVMLTLNNAHTNGSSLAFAIYIGGVPAGQQLTDGRGVASHEDVAITSGSLVNSKRVYVTSQDAVTFDAITEGDYVDDGGTDIQITKLSVVSNKLNIGTEQSTQSSSSTVDIVRPGIKWGFNARITSFEHSGTNDDVWTYTITARVSGKVNQTIGNPDVTVT